MYFLHLFNWLNQLIKVSLFSPFGWTTEYGQSTYIFIVLGRTNESSPNKCTSIHKAHTYFHKLLIHRMNLELKEILGLLIPIVSLPKTKNCIVIL